MERTHVQILSADEERARKENGLVDPDVHTIGLLRLFISGTALLVLFLAASLFETSRVVPSLIEYWSYGATSTSTLANSPDLKYIFFAEFFLGLAMWYYFITGMYGIHSKGSLMTADELRTGKSTYGSFVRIVTAAWCYVLASLACRQRNTMVIVCYFFWAVSNELVRYILQYITLKEHSPTQNLRQTALRLLKLNWAVTLALCIMLWIPIGLAIDSADSITPKEQTSAGLVLVFSILEILVRPAPVYQRIASSQANEFVLLVIEMVCDFIEICLCCYAVFLM